MTTRTAMTRCQPMFSWKASLFPDEPTPSVFPQLRSPGGFRWGRHRLALALMTISLSGCGAEAAPGPTAEVRDSAGILLTENRGALPEGGGGWSVASEPSLVLGSLAGAEENQLYRVRGALKLNDGRIVVANGGSQGIRIYDPGGHLQNRYGGDGEGPGEFRSVMLVGCLGDSLVVLDRRLRKVTLIHPDEGFLRAFNLADGVAAYPLGAWLFQTGSILIRDLPLVDSGAFDDGFHRTPVPFRSADMTGALETDFGGFPGAEQVTTTRQTEHGLATLMNSLPFGRSPQIAVSGDRLFLGTQDDFQVKVMRSDGTLERIIRLDTEPTPITDADLQAYIDDEVAAQGDEEVAPGYRRQLEEMPRAEFRPAHGEIAADPDGFLFVADYAMPQEDTRAVRVFDPDG